ncbi:uncharacterized protein LOC131218308 isoform X2 [Magnolia sinica]|uniref:uncharacterized protein LOC131218308 isoform X2 n=1 Tax=Magnolia sinica TaxID=86752 RepID=UPI002659BD29|nr:uncharacterized protein LOC131218308 isoform X2 [Magnolia sinica]
MVIIHINLTWKLTKRDEALVQSKSAIEKETMTKKRRQLIDKQPDGSSGGYSGGIRDLETQLKLYDGACKNVVGGGTKSSFCTLA